MGHSRSSRSSTGPSEQQAVGSSPLRARLNTNQRQVFGRSPESRTGIGFDGAFRRIRLCNLVHVPVPDGCHDSRAPSVLRSAAARPRSPSGWYGDLTRRRGGPPPSPRLEPSRSRAAGIGRRGALPPPNHDPDPGAQSVERWTSCGDPLCPPRPLW